MRTIKKILCPTDFSPLSENAVRYAWQLASVLGAKIDLLHIIFPDTESIEIPAAALSVTRRKLDDAEQLLLGLQERMKELGDDVAAGVWVEMGSASPVIAQVAERENVDLIVIGARGDGRSQHKLFGSNTQDVISLSKKPVWVVPEYAAYQSIAVALFGTDLSEATPFHVWEASQMLSSFAPTIKCVHVQTANKAKTAISMQDLEAFFAQRSSTASVSFDEIQDDEVAGALQEAAFSWEADLVIMVRPRRSWLERLLHHSETLAFSKRAEVPLLILPEE